ncbi:hypothetical protein MBLNU230_g4493t1 [Neophaeotheca triangularis]
MSRVRLQGLARAFRAPGRYSSRRASTRPTPEPPATPPPHQTRFHRLRRFWDHPDIRYIRLIFFRFSGLYFFAHVFITHFFSLQGTEGVSMLPTLNSFGDWLLISKYYRHGREVRIGDVVSFRSPVNVGIDSCKRVVGLPGDFVVRDTPGNGVGWMYQVPDGHCVVVGDNLTFSRDSRMWGPLPMALIKGKAIAKVVAYDEDGFIGRWVPWFRPLDGGLQDAPDDELD